MQLIKVLDLDIYFSCWFFKISPPSENAQLSKGFLFECTAVNHLHNTLSNCTNVCYFDVYHLKRPSHVHLMSQTIVISPSVSLYHIQLMFQCSMNPHHTLAFATLCKPPNYFKFLGKHWSCILPLANSTLPIHLFIFWSHYSNSTGSKLYRKPGYRIRMCTSSYGWWKFVLGVTSSAELPGGLDKRNSTVY